MLYIHVHQKENKKRSAKLQLHAFLPITETLLGAVVVVTAAAFIEALTPRMNTDVLKN